MAEGEGGTGNEGGTTWTSGLSEANATAVQSNNWADVNAVVDSYRGLQERSASMVSIPGADASPEDVTAFRGKLGVPGEANAYEFKMPDGLPEDMPYDDALRDQFKAWAHKAGLTPDQAQGLHDMVLLNGAESLTAAAEELTSRQNSATDTLAKDWGPPDSEAFKRNVELSDRAVRQLGGEELREALVRGGVLGADGSVLEPLVAVALAKVGGSLFHEDAVYGGPSSQNNPFSAEHENLTEQGRILRSNPQHAKTLIQMAGLKPDAYGLAAA